MKTLLAVEVPINTNMQLHVPSRNNCFQLLGFDVMLDEALKPWLIEVNTAPSLATDSPMDKQIKAAVVTDTLHMIMVRAYDRKRLEAALEREKQARLLGERQGRSNAENIRRREVCAGQRSALADMTEDDYEVLSDCEQEFGRVGGFKRCFPNPDMERTMRWSKFFESRRYYNLLVLEYMRKVAEEPGLTVNELYRRSREAQAASRPRHASRPPVHSPTSKPHAPASAPGDAASTTPPKSPLSAKPPLFTGAPRSGGKAHGAERPSGAQHQGKSELHRGGGFASGLAAGASSATPAAGGRDGGGGSGSGFGGKATGKEAGLAKILASKLQAVVSQERQRERERGGQDSSTPPPPHGGVTHRPGSGGAIVAGLVSEDGIGPGGLPVMNGPPAWRFKQQHRGGGLPSSPALLSRLAKNSVPGGAGEAGGGGASWGLQRGDGASPGPVYRRETGGTGGVLEGRRVVLQGSGVAGVPGGAGAGGNEAKSPTREEMAVERLAAALAWMADNNQNGGVADQAHRAAVDLQIRDKDGRATRDWWLAAVKQRVNPTKLRSGNPYQYHQQHQHQHGGERPGTAGKDSIRPLVLSGGGGHARGGAIKQTSPTSAADAGGAQWEAGVGGGRLLAVSQGVGGGGARRGFGDDVTAAQLLSMQATRPRLTS
jgi:hypothetical protein